MHRFEDVIAAGSGAELIYVPCHRSHIDYLLLSYVIYHRGLQPPHIAAGDNLNLPLIGPILRRGGAFFLRRSFKDDPLYAAVFAEYLHVMLVPRLSRSSTSSRVDAAAPGACSRPRPACWR